MGEVPRWRNGRRGGLKIRFLQGSVGSSPSLGTSQSGKQLVSNFLKSRREGLSPGSIEFYQGYLGLANTVIGFHITGQDISQFLSNLRCTNGGKHAYYRALRAFYNWLYSPKSGHGLNPQDNPILLVESPKVERKILPSLTTEQLDYVIDQAECVRDKAIVCLFADSGLRLSESANIEQANIDWQHRLIKVRCKGGKEGLAPFGQRTEKLLREWLSEHPGGGKLWDLEARGIAWMLWRLGAKTGLPCNAHTFRRTFASVLSKRGVDSLHIMRLGRWQSLAMVDRYTRSVQFEDSLRL